MAAGTVLMTVVGCFLNAFVLLPAYAKAFGMPIDGLVGMGTAVNKHITDLKTFVILAVGPFNLLKGVLVTGFVSKLSASQRLRFLCFIFYGMRKRD